jgi:hypothetical protein
VYIAARPNFVPESGIASVISTGVSPRWFTLAAAVAVTACSAPTHSPSASSTPRPGQAINVNQDNIRRVRGAFPPGFEVTETRGEASPATFWGLKPGWSSQPPECGALADPAVGGSSPPQGFSGSGDGGIVYVIVAASASGAEPDPGAVAACSHWSMESGRTSAIVDSFAPAGAGVSTFGMITAIRTVVEGGTETDLRATTVTAYLGEYVAFVTVVTDPGAQPSALPDDLAQTMLTKTVATLRR